MAARKVLFWGVQDKAGSQGDTPISSLTKDDGCTSSNGSSKVTRKPLVRIMDAEVLCGDF